MKPLYQVAAHKSTCPKASNTQLSVYDTLPLDDETQADQAQLSSKNIFCIENKKKWVNPFLAKIYQAYT